VARAVLVCPYYPAMDEAAALRIYTIGHSTRALEELLALLRTRGVATLVDVRTIPRSRRNPQFARESLAASLPEASIRYLHMPGLGGLRRPRPDSTNTGWRNAGFRGYADYMETAEFARNLATLIGEAARGPVAFMCAEAVPWRCHRSLIADALTVQGLAVEHILSASATEPHRLTPFARVQGTRVAYPGGAGQGSDAQARLPFDDRTSRE
jgi:uncharacterized protein (DUF488 family)